MTVKENDTKLTRHPTGDIMTIFDNTVALFAEHENTIDKAVIMNGVIRHYFPDELICSSPFRDCVEVPNDTTFTFIFTEYFVFFYTYPEIVRKHSDILVKEFLNNMTRTPDEDEVDIKDGIDINLKAIIGLLRRRKNEIGTGLAERMIDEVKQLEEQWEKDASFNNLIKILNYLLSGWDYFYKETCTGGILRYAAYAYIVPYDKTLFFKVYSIFVKLSKINYCLETSVSSLF